MKTLYARSIRRSSSGLSLQRMFLALLCLILALGLTLSQRFTTQHTQLEQTSQLIAQSLVDRLEHSETILLSLADHLYQPTGPELESLQRQMNQAMRFSDTIGRILLVQGGQVILDSDQNHLANRQLIDNQALPPVTGLEIGRPLPAGLPAPLYASSWLPLTLHLPAAAAEPGYTFLLLMDSTAVSRQFELLSDGPVGHYGLYRHDGTLLLGRNTLATWPQQVADPDASSSALQLDQHNDSLFPLHTLYYRCQRYPVTLVRTLDYFCSLGYWAEHNLLAILMVLTSLVLVLAPRRKSGQPETT